MSRPFKQSIAESFTPFTWSLNLCRHCSTEGSLTCSYPRTTGGARAKKVYYLDRVEIWEGFASTGQLYVAERMAPTTSSGIPASNTRGSPGKGWMRVSSASLGQVVTYPEVRGSQPPFSTNDPTECCVPYVMNYPMKTEGSSTA